MLQKNKIYYIVNINYGGNSLDKKKEYLYNVQKFLDLIENIKDDELKNDIRNSYFSSIRALCDISNFDMDSLKSWVWKILDE